MIAAQATRKRGKTVGGAGVTDDGYLKALAEGWKILVTRVCRP
ncbi:hypothetical protein [Streptomyces sp. B5E4]